MKQELSKGVFFAIIVVVVIVAGFFLWAIQENPNNRADSGEAAYREAEEWVKKQGKDPKAELGLDYYRYHPEEWANRPKGIANAPLGKLGGPPGVDIPGIGQPGTDQLGGGPVPDGQPSNSPSIQPTR